MIAGRTYWLGAYRSGTTKKFIYYSDGGQMSDTDGIMTGSSVAWTAGRPTETYTDWRIYWSGTDKLIYDDYHTASRYYICEHFGISTSFGRK